MAHSQDLDEMRDQHSSTIDEITGEVILSNDRLGDEIRSNRMGEETSNTKPTYKRPPTALTLQCQICGAPAPDHLHFGGHCCYSCRAFFRRSTKRKSVKGSLRCRSGTNNCLVTEETRNCISCRYDKCIKAGMKAEFLRAKRKMSEEEEAAEDLTDFRGSLEEPSGSHYSDKNRRGQQGGAGKKRPSESSSSPTQRQSLERSPPAYGGSPSSFGMRSPTSFSMTSPNNSNAAPTSPDFVPGGSSFRLSPNYGQPSSVPEVSSAMVEVKTEVEEMPRGWNQERRDPQLQRGVGVPPPLPWPDHLQRPDFFHRPTEHRAPAALNHHLLAMEQLPPSLNERLPMMVDHRPYDHRSMLGIGHRLPERSIINHRPLEHLQMPKLIHRSEAGPVQRASVIRRSSAGVLPGGGSSRQDPRSSGGFPEQTSFSDDRQSMQYREEMVRFHGSILRETGKIFSRQADILEQTCQASVGAPTWNIMTPNRMELEGRDQAAAGRSLVKLEMPDKGDAVDPEKKHGTDFKAEPNEVEGKEMVMKDIKEIEEKEFMSQSLMKREKNIKEIEEKEF